MRYGRLKADAEAERAHYHCLSRVVNRDYVFGPLEKEHFVGEMRRYERFCGLQIVTYCVMSNHFHVLVEVPRRPEPDAQGVLLDDTEFLARVDALQRRKFSADAREMIERLRKQAGEGAVEEYKRSICVRMWDVSWFMRLLKQRFSQWFNRRAGRKGTLWEERFKSVLVEGTSEALATMAAYIDLNPVRARMVFEPGDYRWSGYAAAQAGDEQALAGLRVIDQARAGHVEVPTDLAGTLANYRLWLYGRGQQREGLLDDEGTVGPVGRVGIDPARVAEVQAKRGRLTRWEMLRCRVRYFSDGVALGTKEWVDGVFARHRRKFGAKRQSGARPMRQVDSGGLHTLRDLRMLVVG